ncbi:trypsin iota-like [Drosophila montana]|uniref:trypsin iota-like n=1 Tax=Drosophila montana TaxID=40370 RepID=UPI00313B056F
MCFKCVLLLLTTTLVAAHLEPALNGSFTSNRIIGGSNEVIENAPWQISLQFLGRHVCGGSIYSEEIIVTAAHCVSGRAHTDLRVRVGSTYHNSGGTLVGVARTLSHERFNQPPYANDIAVIRLSTPLTFGRSVQPIALARTTPGRKTSATVTGWGFRKKLPVSPTQLQSVKLRIMSHKLCWKINFGIITNDMVCAFDWKKGACNGDSGGPLVVNRELVGVVSFGKFMCFGPTVFANVAVQHDWILEAVKVISKQDSTAIPSTRPTTTESSTTTTTKGPSTTTATTKEPTTTTTTTTSTTTTTTETPSTTPKTEPLTKTTPMATPLPTGLSVTTATEDVTESSTITTTLTSLTTETTTVKVSHQEE